MAVKRCDFCQADPVARRQYGGLGLAEGRDCPICYRPACRFHLTTVRWRWCESGELDAALICKPCKNSYAHRNWDAINRDWIT
jgi:hypothetical protein